MRKRYWTLALAGLSIVAAACVCTSALPGDLLDQNAGEAESIEKEPDTTGDEDATGAEPEPAARAGSQLPVEYNDPVGGVSMNLPEGWVTESAFGLLSASADPAMMGEDGDIQQLTAPAMIGVFGSAADILEGEDVATVEDLTDSFMNEIDLQSGDVELGEVEDRMVGGHPAQMITMSGYDTDLGADFEGAIVTVLTDQQAGVLFVVVPQGQWADFAPTFDDILASIAFFEPNPDAALEGLGVTDTGGETAAQVRPIASGEAKVDTLPDGGVHDWTFEGTQGQLVGMSVNPVDDDFDAELTVLGPDGEILLELDDGFSGEMETASLTLPATGTYTVRVTGFAGFGGGYAVSISVS